MSTNLATCSPSAATQGPSAHDARLECSLRSVIDGGPAAIAERLEQLDHEWTTGRATKATAAVLIVAGLALSLLNPWWLALPVIGGAILLQYLFGRRSVTGALFHSLGLRSGSEIDQEKTALKALRGDFQHLPTLHQVEDRDATSRMEGEGGIAVEYDEPKVPPDAAVKEVIGAVKG
jgi:hypothetical protein